MTATGNKRALWLKHSPRAVLTIPGSGFYAADSRRRYDQVEKYAGEALKIDSSRIGAYTLRGQDLPRAETYFRKYLTQEPEAAAPDHGAAHWGLGLVLEKEGRKQDAIREVETASRLNPKLEGANKDLRRLK